MRSLILKLWVLTFVILIHAIEPVRLAGQENAGTSILNLKSAIVKVLESTNTPAAGIALVNKDGPVWIAGLGKADIEKNINANERTLFRIASISKMFVALSILKLQEEGKLDLEDKVHDLAPDVAFDNPWEDTDPVRIAHLLEHTTGWDDYHLVEQVRSPITLKQALDFHPHSRRSRWVPGSRMAYSNSGSGVAAYIVEKITGLQYEDYVNENFFRPLKMVNTTFFDDARHQKWGATSYDGKLEPLPYRHVIQRPAGAIHSSAFEMANFVRFLLNRGAIDSLPLLSRESIERMEVSKTTLGARAGLELGYGLANFTSVHGEFVYQGHDGGLPGALSELAYLPEHGVGHVIFLNAMNGQAFTRISQLVRDFETRDLKPTVLETDSASANDFSFGSGYYQSINPRVEGGYFLDRIFDIYSFRKEGDCVVQRWLFPGAGKVYYPASDSKFRLGSEPKIGLVKAVDPAAGEVLYTDSRVFKPAPTYVVFGQLAILTLWLIMMAIGSLVAFIALLRPRSTNRRDALKLILYPVMGSFIFFATVCLMAYAQRHLNHLLAAPGILSLTIMAMSVWFILCVIWSWVTILSSRMERAGRLTFWTMTVLSVLHLVVTCYLLWFQALPVMTWA